MVVAVMVVAPGEKSGLVACHQGIALVVWLPPTHVSAAFLSSSTDCGENASVCGCVRACECVRVGRGADR